jgi:hypothetical protein
MSENTEPVKISKKKDIQKKCNTIENAGQINWNVFRYQNSNPQNISLFQTFI